MRNYHPNMTVEEYITGMHINLSHVDDRELRDYLVDHLCDVKDQLDFLEHTLNLPPYEPNRSV